MSIKIKKYIFTKLKLKNFLKEQSTFLLVRFILKKSEIIYTSNENSDSILYFTFQVHNILNKNSNNFFMSFFIFFNKIKINTNY